MGKENSTWVVTICENWSETRGSTYLGTVKVTAISAEEAAQKALIVAKESWYGCLSISSVDCESVKDISLEEAILILETYAQERAQGE